MIKAKNLNRLAVPAVFTLILCCVASAGPTYSFVKIAGEWAFYDDSEGFNAVDEVVQVNQRPNGIADRRLPASEEDEVLSLPAVGSVINLSTDGSAREVSTLFLGSSSSGGAQLRGRTLQVQSSDENVTIAGKPYPGTSVGMIRTTLRDGFDGPDRDGWIRTLPNGKPRTLPNGNAWGYWKKNGPSDIDDDMASPVPVPVPGSVILAAIGAGLVKLLHDRRLKR